jgi:hypothetical protein
MGAGEFMIIDIDIQISDENGKRVHRFAKRFDEGTNSSNNGSKSAVSNNKFEDFLAEYLSASGRAIRDKLICKLNSLNNQNYEYNRVVKTTPSTENLITVPDGELEYKISIGNRNVLIGKIPLPRIARIANLSENLSKLEKEKTIELEEVNKDKQQNSANLTITNRSLNEINEINEIKEIETSLTNLMSQALQKYESSFYVAGTENESNKIENLG